MTHHSGLENRRSGNATEGSNPSLSAIFRGYSPRNMPAHDAPFASRSTQSNGAHVGTSNCYPDLSIPRVVPVAPGAAMIGKKHGEDHLAMYGADGRLMFIFESAREVYLNVPQGDDDSPITGEDISRAAVVSDDEDARDGFAYFVGGDAGAIKIGRSVNPETRLKELQAGSPIPLRILALRPGKDRERLYHQLFAAHRLHGEWFAPYPDILAEIERLTTKDTPHAS